MDIRELIPGLGEKTTRQRVKELEKEAGTLPVIFSLFFTEALKEGVIAIPFLESFPESVAISIQMTIASAIVALIYVYQLDPENILDVSD